MRGSLTSKDQTVMVIALFMEKSRKTNWKQGFLSTNVSVNGARVSKVSEAVLLFVIKIITFYIVLLDAF